MNLTPVIESEPRVITRNCHNCKNPFTCNGCGGNGLGRCLCPDCLAEYSITNALMSSTFIRLCDAIWNSCWIGTELELRWKRLIIDVMMELMEKECLKQ